MNLSAILLPAKRIIDPLVDFIYPPHCLGCNAMIHAEDVLCARCMCNMIRLPFNEAASRDHLASLSHHIEARIMYVAYDYERESILETCIHTMKYRGLHRIACWFGRLLGEGCIGTSMLEGDPILAPIPLHRLKKIERGYNQAEYICRGMAQEAGMQFVPDLLVRTRYTRSQAMSRLDISGRRDNVLNAFIVHPRHAAGLAARPVILVDDLITTGATMAECATVLREEGVVDLRLAAIARPVKS